MTQTSLWPSLHHDPVFTLTQSSPFASWSGCNQKSRRSGGICNGRSYACYYVAEVSERLAGWYLAAHTWEGHGDGMSWAGICVCVYPYKCSEKQWIQDEECWMFGSSTCQSGGHSSKLIKLILVMDMLALSKARYCYLTYIFIYYY